eukprot:m51a1_g14437 hypothetical protein (287) ;mRNA; r:548607-550063
MYPVQVVMYDDDMGSPAPVPRHVTNATLVAVPAPDKSGWLNFVSLQLVAAAPRVWIGYRVTARCATFTAGSSYAKWPTPRLAFHRDAQGRWARYMADWSADNVSALAIRAAASRVPPASLVPAGWSCAPRRYNDNDSDCGCGLWDPACARSRSGPVSPDCDASAGHVCGRAGRCVATGWDASRCPLRSFGSYDGCDCGCGGALDRLPRLDAGRGPLAPQAWPDPACPASAYNDTRRCDCGCAAGGSGGVVDPDCAVQGLPSDCGQWACFKNACRAFPAAWHCPVTP